MRLLRIVPTILVLSAAVLPASAEATPEPQEYRLESASVSLSTTQAGGHPDFTTTFQLHKNAEGFPYGLTRDVMVTLPPGLIGDPQAFPKCTQLQFGTEPQRSACPQDSQVGTVDISFVSSIEGYKFGGASYVGEPLYNMPALGGNSLARLGFYGGPYPLFLNARLDPETNSVVAGLEDGPAIVALTGSTTTLWGVPGSPVHDRERLTPWEVARNEALPEGRKSNLPETPFLTSPTSCGAGREVAVSVRSYQTPESVSTKLAPFPQISGCGMVTFGPVPTLEPTTSQAATPTGLDYELSFPTNGLEHANLLADSTVKRDEVVLPQGMTINPSEAVGLGVCSEADFARERYDSLPNEGCPETSKIGTVTADTPLIDRNPVGSLYLARPYANPFGTLLALYMTLKVPDRGVLVKLKGKITLDPVTGQITTVFDNLPELPVAGFHLHFREGARAPLVTPAFCGAYDAISELTPWSAPDATFQKENTFLVESGPGHTPCPSGPVLPFKPALTAGTVNNSAGSFTQMDIRISRGDGEQELTGFSSFLPLGLTGKLAGIPLCSDAAVEAARTKTGQQELSEPSCQAASEIGHTFVGAGVGDVLSYTPGKIYLAGPYHGSALSVVSITSATVGPFDLGTVVIRFALRINPSTGAVEIDAKGSDPIPHIIDGIVVHVRDIHVYVDRPNFMINPTSCAPMSLTATATGAGADIASPADDSSATVANRFQVAECQSLRFKPTFKLSTSGRTSRHTGASLDAKVTYPTAPMGTYANIAKVKVTLPRKLPSRLETLQKACLDTVFEANPAACPSASRVGMAIVHTQLLPVQLVGPAYFVSHGAREFPDLMIVLQGYGITVDLRGQTFISKKGLTSSTFRTVPDVPFESFELKLPQGAASALTNNGNLCKGKLFVPTAIVAQNGAVIHQSTRIAVSGCTKKKAVARKHRGRRKAKK